MVQAARRIGRALAANGPITIDDITESMAELYNVLPATGKRQHSWKGSVFTKSEWVYVGDTPSRQVSAHGRPVGMWALKSWLANNTLNGKNTHVSGYVLTRIFGDFKRLHRNLDYRKCNWFIGDEQLAAEIRGSIQSDNNTLYQVPVTFVPGSIGALIQPPTPGAILQ